jgi:uncharacterized protein (UPF0548 family)
MAEWRIGRGWTEDELVERLEGLRARDRNFDAAEEEMTLDRGWNRYHSESVVALEPPGEPTSGGAFERGREAVAGYRFSDPAIVIGHFDPSAPLAGRDMLLEMIALRVLHYLGGVRVGAVRNEYGDRRSVFGFRYDTLAGHIERGSEWFLLRKEHGTGEISFRIEAGWRPGEFPNRWSRIGFRWAGPHYQRVWHHRAHGRLSRLLHADGDAVREPAPGRLAHQGPEVEFQRFAGRTTRPEPEAWKEDEDRTRWP